MSAYQHRLRGSVLGVLDGSPGTLVLWDRSVAPTSVTTVGELGNHPRRLRCLLPWCVVSNYGSNSITVINWDGESSEPRIVGTVPVGDGPVGIDLARQGDNVAVVSTGFNDNSYSVTVLGPDGNVVSNTKHKAPEGCVNPGYAGYAEFIRDNREAGTRKILMTCHGSDNFAIVEAGP